MLALLAATLLSTTPPPEPVPGLEGVPVSVERRLLAKRGRTFVAAGGAYFLRGDYYTNPGLAFSGSFYVDETSGLELRVSLFFSWLNAGGSEVFERTGLLPDAHRPLGGVLFGYRHLFGYGKLKVGGNPGDLWHFDFQVAGHGGLVFTDRAVSPTLSVGPGVLARLGPALFAQLDVGLTLGIEERSRGSLALGLLPSLTVGTSF